MTMQDNHTQVTPRDARGRSLRLLALVVVLAIAVDAFGQTDPRPGETDPLGKPSRYTLFPDQELLAVLAHDPATAGLNAEFSFNSFAPSGDLTNLTPLGGATNVPIDLSAAHMGAGAGRILAPDRDQVVYARRTGSSVAVAFLGYTNSTTTLSPLANRLSSTADVFDIAVGDLDKSADEQGNNHDEVVVCFATTPNYEVRVGVLDYTAPAPAPADAVRPQATTTALTSRSIDLGGAQPIDAVVACTLGDFDGDGQNEIAVVGLDGGRTLWVSLLRYTIGKDRQRTLQQVSTTAVAPSLSSEKFAGTVDVAAGDFNDDGKDDLAVSYVLQSNCPAVDCFDYTPSVVVAGSDQKLNLTFGGRYEVGDLRYLNADPGRAPGVQVVSGLFKFDPAHGFGFGRRQLALVTNLNTTDDFNSVPHLEIDPLTVSNDLGAITSMGAGVSLNYPDDTIITPHFSVVAGGFRGNGDINNSQWALAVGTWVVPSIYDLRMFTFADGSTMTFEKRYTQPVLGEFGRFPLVAYDADGDSVYLGAPVHSTLSNVLRPQFIFQEPPKHMAYLSGQLVNVSRELDFYVELKDSVGTTFSSTSTDTTDWNIGGSEEGSAKFTAQVGDLKQTGAKASAAVSVKAGYDYNEHQESYNSQYASRTLTFTGQTNTDDYLVADLQTFDVWRYRAFGIPTTDEQKQPLNGFYELVLPGPKVEVRGGGLGFDWYHPLHENGNILSYPALTSDTFTPSDLGPFTLPDGTKKTEPLVPATLLAFDGTSGTIQLNFSQTSGSGASRKSSHTLKENVDVNTAFKAAWGVDEIGQQTVEVTSDLNFHNSNSWSTLTASNSETNTSTGITLHKSVGDTTRAYNFAPVFYFTQDGTVKVVQAVDVLGNAAGRAFWAQTYGQKPDPALNLPLRFRLVDPKTRPPLWGPNLGTSRKQVRGFFLRKADLNPVTNDYDYLAGGPAAGDKVRLEARIYNYSTAQPANNLAVRFQVIRYDDATDTELPFTSCPAGTLSSGRCTIGETVVLSLAPLAMRTAAIIWDTTGFGPVSSGGSVQYRIYVILDPNNTIDEIYENDSVGGASCTDPTKPGSFISCNPGQNNDGYGVITIHHPATQDPPRPPHADVRLRKGALAAIDAKRGTLFTDAVDAYLNRPLCIRVQVVTDASDPQHYHLLVYKGDPQQGGEVIAGKLLQGVDAADGTYVWFEWTPTELGNVTLSAQLVEQVDDVIPGNGKRVLKVRVKPVPKGR